MIATCNRLGKPVVTATQMLESMIDSPRPTRAEASDVANAVLDGTDCVMLSGETANGAFPVSAVTIMRRICEEAEIGLDYMKLFLATQARVKADGAVSFAEALCMSAVRSATDMSAKLIVAITGTGHTAQLMAKYRPQCQILAFASESQVVRQLQCVRGVVPVLSDDEGSTEAQVNKALYWAKIHGLVKAGDLAITVHSIQAVSKPHLARKDSLLESPGIGESNMVRVVTVS